MIKNRLIAGLLVWLPLGVTVLVIRFLLDLFNNFWELVPEKYLLEEFVDAMWVVDTIEKFPGISAAIVLTVVVYLTGYIVSNFIGKRAIVLWESFLGKIPGVRTIYGSIKQMSEAIFASGDKSFKKVHLVEYPRKGLWALAFETSNSQGESHQLIKKNKDIDSGVNVINLFIPTTPNPTSGYFIMASPDELIEVSMSVEDALKMIVSGGVFVPQHADDKLMLELKKSTKTKKISKIQKKG